ncbi:MAG: acyltransferase [Flavobacteriales bacterium]|nr:acyltransferase [Flavobacteriales bacterium]
MERPSEFRYVYLDGLRMAAALWVFLFHYARNAPPWTHALKPVATTGAWGVGFFFLLSGYVLTLRYQEDPQTPTTSAFLKRFYLNRLFRLAPVYYSTLALFLLLYGLVLNEEVPLLPLALHLVFLQAWPAETALTLNFPAWSLSCEVFFYLAFPLLLQGFKRLRATLPQVFFHSMCAGFLMLPMLWPIIFACPVGHFYHPFYNLPLFLGGMALAMGRFSLKTLGALVGLGILGWGVQPQEVRTQMAVNGWAATPVFAWIVRAGAFLPPPGRLLGKVLKVAGGISYPFYLAQYFSMLLTKYIYWQFLSEVMPRYTWAHGLLVNSLVSGCLWICVEKPAQKWRQKKFSHKT